MKTTDEQTDAIRAQVDAELPRPAGGFENPGDEDQWKAKQEARFFRLVHRQALADTLNDALELLDENPDSREAQDVVARCRINLRLFDAE